MGAVLSTYLPPPPPASGPPSHWGDPDVLDNLFSTAGLRMVESETRRLDLDFPDPATCTDFLIRTAGHVVAERENLMRADRRQDLHSDLHVYVAERGHNAEERFRLSLDYLLATATKET